MPRLQDLVREVRERFSRFDASFEQLLVEKRQSLVDERQCFGTLIGIHCRLINEK